MYWVKKRKALILLAHCQHSTHFSCVLGLKHFQAWLPDPGKLPLTFKFVQEGQNMWAWVSSGSSPQPRTEQRHGVLAPQLTHCSGRIIWKCMWQWLLDLSRGIKIKLPTVGNCVITYPSLAAFPFWSPHFSHSFWYLLRSLPKYLHINPCLKVASGRTQTRATSMVLVMNLGLLAKI